MANSTNHSCNILQELFDCETEFHLIAIKLFMRATTIGLFFTVIPICRQIWRQKDTVNISDVPFLSCLLSGCFGFVYSFLNDDKSYHVMRFITGVQIVLFSMYILFYWLMSRKKIFISLKIALLLSILGVLLAVVLIFQKDSADYIGIINMALSIADFASPLAGLRVVLRNGNTSTLPLALCIAKLVVSTEWLLYGSIVMGDRTIIIPNGCGCLLSIVQMVLFVVLPRKINEKPPIFMGFDKIKAICKQEEQQESKDIEKFQVEKGMSKSSTEVSELASQLESELMKPAEYEVCVKEDENGSKKSDDIVSL